MVESRKAKIGNGLFSKTSFKKGDVIGIIKGKKITDIDENNNNYIDIGHDEVLHPNLPYRHINHSCEPNCEFTLEINENDKNKKTLYLEAIKNITSNQELFTDYAWEPEFTIPCKCEADKCRGWIIHPKKLHLIDQNTESNQALSVA